MKSFFEGFVYPFKSIGLFFKYPKTIIHSIIPVTINMVLYLSTFFLIYSRIMEQSAKFTGADATNAGFWSEFINVIILIVSFILVLVICYFVLLIIGGIISAPFNENISLIIEENLTGLKTDYNPGFWKDTWLNILSEIKKLSFYFIFIFVFFLIGFIPLIGGIISVVLSSLFSFYFNALDFYDYPMTRRFYTFRQKIRITSSKPLYSLGFGCAAFLIMFLPVVNVLLKPLCVISGTAFYFEKQYGIYTK